MSHSLLFPRLPPLPHICLSQRVLCWMQYDRYVCCGALGGRRPVAGMLVVRLNVQGGRRARNGLSAPAIHWRLPIPLLPVTRLLLTPVMLLRQHRRCACEGALPPAHTPGGGANAGAARALPGVLTLVRSTGYYAGRCLAAHRGRPTSACPVTRRERALSRVAFCRISAPPFGIL